MFLLSLPTAPARAISPEYASHVPVCQWETKSFKVNIFSNFPSFPLRTPAPFPSTALCAASQRRGPHTPGVVRLPVEWACGSRSAGRQAQTCFGPRAQACCFYNVQLQRGVGAIMVTMFNLSLSGAEDRSREVLLEGHPTGSHKGKLLHALR